MNEYELKYIWTNKLREFNDVMRLDSIIILAMHEAIKEAQSKQFNVSIERAKKYARDQHFLGAIGKEFVDFDDWKEKD